MSRIARPVIPAFPLHITKRGNNRMTIFHDEEDHYITRLFLLRASRKFDCAIHSYVMMNNHFHLLCSSTNETGPANMMQSVGTSFVRHYNRRYGRTGTPWEGRFHSSIIDSSRYFFACSRYIELNPVRARIVDHPSKYAWSSFQHNAGTLNDSMLAPHPLYSALGKTIDDRKSSYSNMFAHAIDPDVETVIREGTRKHLVTGASSFRELAAHLLGRPISLGKSGGDRRSDGFRSLARHG